jgi:hypothetical protein
MKFTKLLAILLAIGMLAAACSGDSEGDGDTASSDAGDSTGATASGGAGIDIDAILAADLDNCAAAPSGDPIKVGMVMDFSEAAGFVDIPGSKLVP